MLVGVLDEESLKLYTLIWSRTVSCQMEASIFEQVILLNFLQHKVYGPLKYI